MLASATGSVRHEQVRRKGAPGVNAESNSDFPTKNGKVRRFSNIKEFINSGETSIRNPDSQPRLGVGPVRIGGGLGNSQRVGGLPDRQTGKVAKLDELGFACIMNG